MSRLVQPLVAPLVGRGAPFGPVCRTGLERSRLAASALLVSAVMALGATTAGDVLDRDASVREAERSYRNAHKRPDPPPVQAEAPVFHLDEVLHQPEKEGLRIARPGLAPRFEWDAIVATRLKHASDPTRDSGPALGRARRAERLARGATLPFLIFGSGTHRSGASSPAFA